MFKRNKSKDIDLLEQYYLATKKKNIFQEYLKYLILPLVLVFIIGGAFGYLKVKQGNYKNDIAEIKQKISDLEKSYKDSDYEEKYASLQEIQKTIDNLKKVNANIASYPNLSEDIYNACYKAALHSPMANQLKGIAIPHRRYAFSSSYQKKNLLILVIHVAAFH